MEVNIEKTKGLDLIKEFNLFLKENKTHLRYLPNEEDEFTIIFRLFIVDRFVNNTILDSYNISDRGKELLNKFINDNRDFFSNIYDISKITFYKCLL